MLRLVLDSLRYWVTEMGVDGFRFDLVTTLLRDERHHVDQDHPFKQAIRDDPVLSQVKMIAEPWDMGPVRLPGRARSARAGASGTTGSATTSATSGAATRHGVAELASGCPAPRTSSTRRPADATASINFVTAHDGFTMRDLVTYDVKHNGANGESNRDGIGRQPLLELRRRGRDRRPRRSTPCGTARRET